MTTSTLEGNADISRVAERQRRGRSRRGQTFAVWATAVLLFPFVTLPLIFIIFGAFQAPDAFGRFTVDLSLDAMERVYTMWPFIRSLLGTLMMAVIVASLAVLIGTVYAWLLCRTDIPLQGLLGGIVIAPLFLSPFIGAFAWLLLAAPRSGMLNNIVRTFFYDGTLFDVTGLKGTIFVLTIYYIPYAFMFMRPALLKMDASLEDASRLSGAGTWRTAFKIVFPVLRPSIAAAFLFVVILATETFSVPAILGTDWFLPLAVRVQRAVEVEPINYSLAGAVGTMLLLVSIVGLFLYRHFTKEARRFVTVSGKAVRPKVLSLGRWRWAAAGICILYGLIAVGLPYTGLVITALSPYTNTDLTTLQLSWENFYGLMSSAVVIGALVNTLILSTSVATACMLLGVVLAYMVNRLKVRGVHVLDYMITVPIAVPGIVFGVGTVWLLVWTPLYNTLSIMIIAFVILYLPFCFRLASNALIQIDTALEEASLVNGSSRARTLLRIAMPLAKSAMISGWIMAFIFSARELSAAIILYGPNTRVLSVLTWDYANYGNMQLAAVVGVLQTGLLIGAVFVARLVFRVKLSEASA